MRKLMLSATMSAMMLAATAVPAFAQTQTATGGTGTVTGGDVTAENSIVAQSQNLFNVSGNVVQQSSSQQQTATNTASATVVDSSGSSAEANAIAVQSAEQTGIEIGDVEQSSSITLAK